MEEIDHVFRDNISKDDNIRAVILTGAGKYFSTGLDLNIFASAEPEVGKDELEKGVASSRVQGAEEDKPWGKGSIVGAVVVMTTMSKPVIAAINGPAVGLGLSLALASDIRIASDRSRFSMIFVKRGLGPDTAASFTLPRIVGLPKAKELLLTGDMLDATEAERIGIVSKVVPHDELMTAARELASKIAKEALNNSMHETDIIKQMELEIAITDKMLNTEDFQEAAAAFLEKREPVFKGR
jgi:2-(1,2-epoxy-1,2-dihydrophenyl)acetyl-CoA isomerase